MLQTAIEQISHQPLPGILEADGANKGKFFKLTTRQLPSRTPKLFYSHPHGEIWLGDTISWLKKLPDESIDLIFADPPYNIKKEERVNNDEIYTFLMLIISAKSGYLNH